MIVKTGMKIMGMEMTRKIRMTRRMQMIIPQMITVIDMMKSGLNIDLDMDQQLKGYVENF